MQEELLGIMDLPGLVQLSGAFITAKTLMHANTVVSTHQTTSMTPPTTTTPVGSPVIVSLPSQLRILLDLMRERINKHLKGGIEALRQNRSIVMVHRSL